MTVLDQHGRRIMDRDPDVTHDPDCPLASPAPPPLDADATSFQATRWCTCGGSAAAGVVSKDRWPHLLAVGFGELMTGLLDNAQVGSHHGIAPHITVQVSLDDVRAGLGGELVMPGSDENVLLTSAAVRRIMCDAAITPVVVQRLLALEAATGTDHLAQLLTSTAVAVLYVGRDKRTVTPAQRRALEARDQHCVFPGCRAHPRRCQAHHVREWENNGPTDIDNLALLCVRHHISVHEGGWSITPTPGVAANETGYWTLHPPPERQP